jgi:DNA mismatch repair ATPase MutS
MDTILFFKQGKFYEIFHMDADIVVRELDLVYMRGDWAHAGFPEISYGFFSERLVALGYRVARIEQVETPAQLKERNQSSGRNVPNDKVVKRALCGIKSKGTRLQSVMDVAAGAAADAAANASNATSSGPTFLFGIAECNVEGELIANTSTMKLDGEIDEAKTNETKSSITSVHMGVAIVDCTTGFILLAEFIDDRHRTRLRTLLARFPAAEFCFERANPTTLSTSTDLPNVYSSPNLPIGTYALSAHTLRMMRYDAPSAVMTGLTPGDEYWGASRTADELLLSKVGVKLDLVEVELTSSNPSSKSTANVRRIDYFLDDKEAGDDIPASSSLSSPQIYADTMTVSGSDGRIRRVPIDLVACIKSAERDGYNSIVPKMYLDKLINASSDPRAAGGIDLPLSSLALAAFGSIISYMRRCLVDHKVLSMRRITRYLHADGITFDTPIEKEKNETSLSTSSTSSTISAPKHSTEHVTTSNASARGEGDMGVPHMILDGATIVNLDILANSYNGSTSGSLYSLFLPLVVSIGGRRRMQQWLCTPLLRSTDIIDRQDAVEELLPLREGPLKSAQAAMRGLPDLEKLLASIHAHGSKVAAVDHPDAAAIFYEEATYNKRKINDLVEALLAFKNVVSIRAAFHDENNDLLHGIKSPLLMRTLHTEFPDVAPLLEYFERAFDARAAKAKGSITPIPGTDASFDAAAARVVDAENALDAYQTSN